MEKIDLRLESLTKALKTLNKALIAIKDPKYKKIHEILRDSAVQRFEYTIDSFWKFLKLYLQEKINIDVSAANPRETLKTALSAKVIIQEEYELLLKGLRHRNLTSHIYDEERADEISKHIPEYYKIMLKVIQKLS
ncbi:HI0074 family nucleotidyltransferase substrate-binding subunit [bacterium]|nr:HI0074 family nucleotidyltransferase substrate-binding subunit [bacterium]